MKGIKKYLPCVVIDSTLQNLRTKLIESGRNLRNLLAVDFPGADAVEEILHDLGYRPCQGRRQVQVHYKPRCSCGEYKFIIHVFLRLYVNACA